MAMVMLGMFALNPVGITGSIVQQLNHGISTGALFLLVGVVYERRHTREISEFGGLSKVMPVYAAVFLMMTMSSIGLPALNGFIGEFLILQGVFVANKIVGGVRGSGVVLGAAYMLYLYQRTMFGKIENPKNERLLDLSLREFATFAPLIALAVWIGIYPAPFLRRLDTSVRHIVAAREPAIRTRRQGRGELRRAAPTRPRCASSNPAAHSWRPRRATERQAAAGAQTARARGPLMPAGISTRRLLLHPAGAGAHRRRAAPARGRRAAAARQRARCRG